MISKKPDTSIEIAARASVSNLDDERHYTFQEFQSAWGLSAEAATLVYDRMANFVSETGGTDSRHFKGDGDLSATGANWHSAAEGVVWAAEHEPPPEPLIFQSGGQLLCPCGSRSLSLGDVCVGLRTISIVATGGDFFAIPHAPPSNRRGACLRISIACYECYGLYNLVLQQHGPRLAAEVVRDSEEHAMSISPLG
jgi:hypothetical protein